MYNPDDLDKEALQSSIDQLDSEEEKRKKAEAEIERARQAEEAAKYAEQQEAIDKGAEASKKNSVLEAAADAAAGVVKGLGNDNPMIQGLNQGTDARNIGYLKGLNGIFTFPERTFDWATGAMQQEIDETGSYSPQWDPFREQIDENAPKNWWEAGIQFGGSESVTVGATFGAGAFTALGKSVLGRLGLAAGETFLDPDTGQGNNMSGSIRWAAENPEKAPKFIQDIYDQVEKNFPWLGDGLRSVAINNPLATNQGDDVNANTVKSVLENLMFEGIGETLDFLWGSRRIDEVDVETQRAEMADEQFEVDAEGFPSQTIDVEATDVTTSPSGGRAELPEGQGAPPPETVGTWRAAKNSPTADPGQGKYNSRSEPDAMWARSKKSDGGPDDMGTVGTPWSAAQVERWANSGSIPPDKVNDIAKKLYSSAYYKQSLGKRDWASGNQQAFRRFQKLLGKNVADMDPTQFWNELFKRMGRTPKNWPVDPVVENILIEDLFSQIRNRGMAGLELQDKFDLMDTDGPLHNIAERLSLYGSEIAKVRKAMSEDILKLPPGEAKKAMEDFSVDDYGFWDEKVQEFFRFIKEQPDDDLANFAAELFAKQNVTSMPEVANYLRNRFKGETFRGEKGKRALMRELNAMTMLAQLADPETLIRAARGTAEILGLQTTTKMLGAAVRGDWRRARAAAAEYAAFKEVIPDMLQIFNKNKDAWWNKDFAQIGNRYKVTLDSDDAAFEAFRDLEMKEGTLGDKVYANMLLMVRKLNRWQGFSYPFAGLGSIDQMLGVLGANQRARNKAFMEMSEGKKPWESIGSKEAFQEARQNYYSAVVDKDGNIDFESDAFLEAAYKEATLTKPLEGPLSFLDDMVEAHPELGLFYRYTTTAVNEIMFDYKSTPILGALHKQTLDIQKALNADDYTSVSQKYGITNRDDALQQRDIIIGRSALGTMILTAFMGMKYNNQLTGNGTTDWRINNAWKTLGWKPNQLSLGPINMDLSEISGLGGIIALASDIADNRKLMGDKWSDNSLAMIAFAIGQGMTNKTMFEPVNNLLRMARGEEGIWTRQAANLATSIPGAKWFDKLGEVLLPYQAELSKSLWDQMRNRLKGGELFRSGEDRLQPKQDVLYGTQLNPWDYVENAVNMVTPINFSLREDRPATDMLMNSGYPTNIISNQHDGIMFEDQRKIRDAYNAALVKEKLGPKLETAMKDPKFMASIAKYHEDLENNVQVENPIKAYHHLKIIQRIVDRAKDNAWRAISIRPDVQALIEAKKEDAYNRRKTLFQSNTYQQTVLNMKNK